MSLTELHTRKAGRRKYTPEESRTINAHFLLTEFAADNEEALLRKVFFATFPGAKKFDGDAACQVVATACLEGGAAFSEALIEVCFSIDRPTHFFHWRRNDLLNYTPKL